MAVGRVRFSYKITSIVRSCLIQWGKLRMAWEIRDRKVMEEEMNRLNV